LLSFVLLRGRCRYCHQPIGWLHPLVELAAVAVAVWAATAGTGNIWINCALGWTLLTLAWIDWRCLLLPGAEFRATPAQTVAQKFAA